MKTRFFTSFELSQASVATMVMKANPTWVIWIVLLKRASRWISFLSRAPKFWDYRFCPATLERSVKIMMAGLFSIYNNAI